MVAREAKPINSGTVRPPKGRLTWMALVGVALFVIMLLMVILRPVVDRRDGPETGPVQVNTPAATAPTASGADAPP